MSLKSFYLSNLDLYAVRAYVRNLLIFPFPDESRREEAANVLAHALQTTLEQHPYLAGTLGPRDPSDGSVPLRYKNQIPDVQKSGLFKDTTIDDPRYDYETLRAQGMPPSMFPGTVFAPQLLRNRRDFGPTDAAKIAEGQPSFAGYTAPPLGVQAFFFSGGLVLSVYAHHSVLDGRGLSVFYKRYAENVTLRSRRDSPLMDPPRRDSALEDHSLAEDHDSARRSVDQRVPNYVSEADRPICRPYVDTAPFRYDDTKSKRRTSECSGRLFVIPAARIRGERDRLVAESKVHTETRLTVFNVLAALVWVHVTRARAPYLKHLPYTDTTIGIAVDCRRRLQPEFDKEYLGNMAVYTAPKAEIKDLVAEDRVTEKTLIPLIKDINRSICEVKTPWIDERLRFFSSLNSFHNGYSLGLRFSFSTDLFITSWMDFGAEHEWNIPGTGTAAPEFIRKPHSKEDGGIIVMPRKREPIDDAGNYAPYEVLVQLASEDMEMLLNEEGGLAQWADMIVE